MVCDHAPSSQQLQPQHCAAKLAGHLQLCPPTLLVRHSKVMRRGCLLFQEKERGHLLQEREHGRLFPEKERGHQCPLP